MVRIRFASTRYSASAMLLFLRCVAVTPAVLSYNMYSTIPKRPLKLGTVSNSWEDLIHLNSLVLTCPKNWEDLTPISKNDLTI